MTTLPKRRHTDQDLNIASIMSERVVVAERRQSMIEVARKMRSHKVGSVLIVEDKKLVGIVTERDLINVVSSGKDPRRQLVKTFMTTKLFTTRPESSISKVLNQMQTKRVRHIPVVNKNGSPVGIVSIRDLMARTQKEMKRLVKIKDRALNTDALTGLKSYRFFNDYLDIEITKCLYNKGCFSLLFMDLDHFKQLNDSEGHTGGNLVLMRLGEILNQREQSSQTFSLRATDVAIRFGGDEFGVILPGANAVGAQIAAERLLKVINVELNRLEGIHPPIPLTISIGIATFPVDAKDRQTLVENADAALYDAKRKGKNRICQFSSMTPDERASSLKAASDEI